MIGKQLRLTALSLAQGGALLTAAVISTAYLVSIGLTAVAFVQSVGWAIASAILLQRLGRGAITALVALIVVLSIGNGSFVEAPYLGSPQIAETSTAAIAQFTRARGFHLSDGHVEDDLRGGSQVQDRHGRYLYTLYAAPIVPEGWTKDQPVPAWALGTSPAGASWRRPLRECIRLTGGPAIADAHGAIADSEGKYGLRSVPDAPLLRWVPSVKDALKAQDTRLGATLFGGWLFWLLSLAIFRAGHGLGPVRT